MMHSAFTMASTQTSSDIITTETSEPTSIRQLLQAYEIHQTEGEEDNSREVSTTTLSSTATSGWGITSPWPSHTQPWNGAMSYNRMPPCRQTGTRHTLASRPAGRVPGESLFVIMMFSGVYVVGVSLRPVQSSYGLSTTSTFEIANASVDNK
jgi:hypothetical protein